MAPVRRAHTRTLAACLFAVPFLAGAIPGFASESVNGGGSPDVTRSLVKVYATKRLPDLARPWSKQPSAEVTGSGMVIAGRRILTSNHVVSYASTVLVQPEGSSEKLRARVVAADLGIDLAVLEPENTSLFAAYPPIAISDDLPDVGSAVAVYGYPTGGQSMSVTKGVVSRVEVTDYFDALALRIQVDAALNPGNSGGPALVGDQLVGVAFSVANSTQNIGYLVPTEEVRSFLNAVDKGEAPAHPRLPISRQTLDNAALRSWLGLETAGQGDVITCLESEVDDYPLKKWDVLSAIGEHDIDNSGLVELKPGLRVAADYFVPKLVHDGRVPMTVMRDGKRLQVEVPVAGAPDRVMKPLNGSYLPSSRPEDRPRSLPLAIEPDSVAGNRAFALHGRRARARAGPALLAPHRAGLQRAPVPGAQGRQRHPGAEPQAPRRAHPRQPRPLSGLRVVRQRRREPGVQPRGAAQVHGGGARGQRHPQPDVGRPPANVAGSLVTQRRGGALGAPHLGLLRAASPPPAVRANRRPYNATPIITPIRPQGRVMVRRLPLVIVAIGLLLRMTSAAHAEHTTTINTKAVTPSANGRPAPAPQHGDRRLRAARPRSADAPLSPIAEPVAVRRHRAPLRARRASQSCHGAAAGGLRLLPGTARESLVGVLPTNPPAQAAGLLRVASRDPDRSFLLEKLLGNITPTEGVRMPLVGRPLSPAQLDLIRRWIAAGAPETAPF